MILFKARSVAKIYLANSSCHSMKTKLRHPLGVGSNYLIFNFFSSQGKIPTPQAVFALEINSSKAPMKSYGAVILEEDGTISRLRRDQTSPRS